MTATQRRKINRQNAQKSTGPKTPEGKERSRQNALRHGLRAETLALPNEDPAAVAAQVHDWIDYYQPESPAELVLVEEAARAALRLRRCSTYETVVLAEQVRHAPDRWMQGQEDRLAQLRALLATDPATAARELKRFGHGRRWLLGRWRELEDWVDRSGGYLPNVALTEEAVRLLGADPGRLHASPPVGYLFRLSNAVARAHPDETFVAHLLSFEQVHPDYHAEYRNAPPDQESARASVQALIRAAIEELEGLEREHAAAERADFNEAMARAQVPAEGPEARLFLRYQNAARSAFHRSLKELTRLLDERAEGGSDGEAAPPAAAPDEANRAPEPQPNPETETSSGESTGAGSGSPGAPVVGSPAPAGAGIGPLTEPALAVEAPVAPVVGVEPVLSPLG